MDRKMIVQFHEDMILRELCIQSRNPNLHLPMEVEGTIYPDGVLWLDTHSANKVGFIIINHYDQHFSQRAWFEPKQYTVIM